MKGINETRTEKVKVEENEFFTGADTHIRHPLRILCLWLKRMSFLPVLTQRWVHRVQEQRG